MNIALDIDGTISRDVKCFTNISRVFKEFGHNVYIVTGREKFTDDLLRFSIDENTENVIYTNRRLKKKVTESLGIKIDIWIDDEPGTIEECKILYTGEDEI